MKQTGSFIEGPILSPLLRFTVPVLLRSGCGGKAVRLYHAGALLLWAVPVRLRGQGIVGAFSVRIPVSLFMSRLEPEPWGQER